MKKTPLKRKKGLGRGLKRVKLSQERRKRKNPTPAQLKKKLDTIFSQYIRAKYEKSCYTCGRTGTLQCGHYISRQYLATRWDERNCRPQCVGCNIYGNGKPLDFEERLKRELGSRVVENMKQTRHTICKLTRQWYEKEIQKYQDKLAQLSST